jgi:hypothetical protein
MAKSTRKAAKGTRSQAKADTEAAPRATGDRLTGSIWHDGKVYDPKKASDQAAFAQLVEREKKLGDKNKDGSPRAQLDMQSLADQGLVSGYGTKSSTKKGKAAKDAEVELDQEMDPDAEVGGGVDAVSEQEAMEEEFEEQDEDR